MSIPERGEVHVWRLDLAREANPVWLETLSADERARADRFRFPHDRHSFASTRGAMRSLLGQYLGVAPQSLELIAGPFGKPTLTAEQNARRITFNVTHSGGYALLAFACGDAVGVDLEQMTATRDLEPSAAMVLSPAELQRFQETVSTGRELFFLRAWTAKEAIVKALGGGLSIPLHRIEIEPGSGEEIFFRAPGIADTSGWSVLNLNAQDSYVAALAVMVRAERVRLWTCVPGPV